MSLKLQGNNLHNPHMQIMNKKKKYKQIKSNKRSQVEVSGNQTDYLQNTRLQSYDDDNNYCNFESFPEYRNRFKRSYFVWEIVPLFASLIHERMLHCIK